MATRGGSKHGSSTAAGVPEVVLVVEDDSRFREMVVECLTQANFAVHEAGTSAEAIEKLRKRRYDAVLTDFKLPGHDGLHILAETNDRWPDAAVILMTGYGTIDLAVGAMKMGADDFVSKPFELARLPHAVRNAIERSRLRAENRDLKQSRADEYRISNIIGRTEAMRKVLQQIESAAAGSENVLLVGEPGTGKARFAKTIHHNSARKGQQFVHVRCDSMTDSTLYEHLFGSLVGSRSDDSPFKPGRFLLAHKGTLFLDGVEALSPRLRSKLDQFLSIPILPRSGSGKHTRVDVRVIASTSRNLAIETKNGRFHRGLYNRLSQRTIPVPPLRDRREDIPGLVQHFLKRYAIEHGSPEKTLSPQVLHSITESSWPGNVWEMKSTIERAAVLSDKREVITAEDLPPAIRRDALVGVMERIYVPDGGIDITSAMRRVERRFVEQGLKTAAGNKSKAAELLGVGRSTFCNMIRRLRLLRDEKEPE